MTLFHVVYRLLAPSKSEKLFFLSVVTCIFTQCEPCGSAICFVYAAGHKSVCEVCSRSIETIAVATILQNVHQKQARPLQSALLVQQHTYIPVGFSLVEAPTS